MLKKLKKAFPFSTGGEVEVEVGSYRRLMRRDYRMRLYTGGYHQSQTIIHECEADVPASMHTLVDMLNEAGVVDGDEFEILVTKTGHRPHGDRWFVIDAKGNMRQETDAECLERIEKGGDEQELRPIPDIT